jgi:hypothetical protein
MDPKRHRQLEEVIKDDHLYNLLLAYSCTRYVGENVSFLKAELNYQYEFLRLSKSVWEILAKSNCLSYRVRENIVYDLKKPYISMFVSAKDEIESFLIDNVLPVFLKTIDVGFCSPDVFRNLEAILASKYKKKFKATARRIGISSEVTHYQAVVKWEKYMVRAAFGLWNEYISPESSSQINIPGSSINSLKQKITKPEIDTFEDARKIIATLVILDVLPGFDSWQNRDTLPNRDITGSKSEIVEELNSVKYKPSVLQRRSEIKKIQSSPVIAGSPKEVPGGFTPKLKNSRSTYRKKISPQSAEKSRTEIKHENSVSSFNSSDKENFDRNIKEPVDFAKRFHSPLSRRKKIDNQSPSPNQDYLLHFINERMNIMKLNFDKDKESLIQSNVSEDILDTFEDQWRVFIHEIELIRTTVIKTTLSSGKTPKKAQRAKTVQHTLQLSM